jgi:hypothetical protein
LFPRALAIGVFWLGMGIVFSFAFSGMVSSNQRKYGAIGAVVILGAVVGVVWRDRQLSLAAPFRRKRAAA